MSEAFTSAIPSERQKTAGAERFLGVIPKTADDVAKMAKRLARHCELDFYHEASG
jgi:hypothetical protein